MRKFANALMLCASLLLVTYPNVAYADELVTTVQEGDPAPFAGTLFNTEAAARLMVDLEFTEEACQLEIDREVGLTKTTMQADIDVLKIQLDSSEKLCTRRLEIRDEQIDYLVATLDKTKKKNGTAIFAGGVVAGIGLTVLSGWAIGQAAGR